MRTGRRAVRHDSGPTSRPQVAPGGERRAKRRRRLTTILGAWLALYAAVAMVMGGPAAHADETHSDLQLVGRIPSALNEQAFVDETGHHVITMSTAPDGNGSELDIYDGATFQKVATKELPYFIGNQNFAPAPWSWDKVGRRLYLVAYPTNPDLIASTNPALLVLDAGMNIVDSHPLTAFDAGVSIVGMSYYRQANRLYLVGQVGDPLHLLGLQDVQIAEVDPTSGKGTMPRAYAVPSCQKAVGDARQAAIVRSSVEPVVFVGCGTGNIIVVGQPGVPGVAAVNVSNLAAPTSTLYPLAGDYAAGESLYDDQARRFVMVAEGPNVSVQSARIFDMDHRVFLGTVGAGNNNVFGTGVDPDGGRLYVSVDGALLIGSQQGLSIPQAEKYSIPTPNYGSIVPVRYSHSILVETTSPDGNWFDVYRSPVGDYTTPADADPDAATNGKPEQPGKTDVNFNGDARAYGSRVLEVAGVNGIGQNIANFQGDYWTLSERTIGVGPDGINDGDRALYFARVNRAFLSQNEASATAISLDGDANNRSDFNTATRPPNSTDPTKPNDAPGQPWPSAPATCVDNGGGATKNTSDETAAFCDKKDASVSVDAIHEKDTSYSLGNSPLVSIGASNSHVTMTRDPKAGVITTTTAEAKDVAIGNQAYFGHITSTATAQAKGQRGTAHADYKRAFENVTIGSFHCDVCDPQQVVAQANAALGSKFLFELPLEEKIATPGGVLGQAQRDKWEHEQDHAVIDQDLTESQVPALRVTYVNDNKTTSRLVFEFAASQADASYAVYDVDDTTSDGANDVAPGVDNTASLGGAVPDNTAPVATDNPGDLGATSVDAQRSDGGSGNLLQRLARRLGHGLRLLLTGRHHTLLNLLLWMLLATPVFLATRRRYLLQLIGEFRS